MLDYTRIYGNTQVIAKPPIKTNKEPLGTALDSFYSDIASLENHSVIDDVQQVKHGEAATSVPIKSQEPPAVVPVPPDPPQISNATTDSTPKDKKKKKVTYSFDERIHCIAIFISIIYYNFKFQVKIVISKKQKQVSSMVAKWKKAQNYEGIN